MEKRRYCRNCGRVLNGKEKFCGGCGEKVEQKIEKDTEKIATKERNSRKKKKAKRKVGVVLGAVFFISLLLVAVFYIVREKKGISGEDSQKLAEEKKEIQKDKKKNDGKEYNQEEYLAFVESEEGKIGAINGKGEIVIPYEFEKQNLFNLNLVKESEFFKSGLCPMEKNEKYGYLDIKGNEIIPFIYDNAGDFAENGLALVKKDEKWGYIDQKGDEIISLIYDDAGDFTENGLAVVEKNEEKMCINGEGETIFTFGEEYDFVDLRSMYDENLGKSLAIVQKRNFDDDSKEGVINEKGMEIIPCIFDLVLVLDSNFIMVEKDEKYGLFDGEGKEILPCVYDTVYSGYGKENKLICMEKNGKYGCLDADGKEILPCTYDYVTAYEEYILTCQDEKWQWIDKNGRKIEELKEDGVYVVVELNGRMGYVDGEGKISFVKYDLINVQVELDSELVAATKNGKWGYLNKKGEEVIPVVYEELEHMDLAEPGEIQQILTAWNSNPPYVPMFPSEGNVVYLDKEGEELKLDQKYDFGREFGENGLAAVGVERKDSTEDKRKYRWSYIDDSGEVALELGEEIVYVGDFFKIDE